MNRQHDIFCTADETALIEFLTRAHAALLAARILPPSLSILDRADAGWIADRADLKALAKEYAAPFKCAGDDGMEFGSLRAALNVFLTGTPTGEYTFRFRTIAADETDNWTNLPLADMKAYGLYLVREKGNGWGDFLENVFVYQNAPDAPKNEYDQTDADVYAEDNANENGGEYGRQFGYTEFDDSPADLDQRADLSEALEFKVALGDLDLSKVTVPEGRIDLAQRVLDAYQEAAEAEADAEAGEYFRGNSCHPKVLLAA